jgi:hypothetical protein
MEELLPAINTAIVIVVSASLTWLAKSIAAYINSKVEDEKLKDVLLRLEGAVETSVRNVSQTVKKELKEATADGKLTKEEIQKLKDTAYNGVTGQLASVDLEKLRDLFGPILEEKIEAMIEAAVSKLKG